jgi:hypothetical protein
MNDKPILTQTELGDYVTRILMALRQDVETELADDGERLAPSDAFYAVLHELTVRFDLDPAQQMLVLSAPAYEFYVRPVPMTLLEPALTLLCDEGSATRVVAI